ncbi:MAG: hypothetical protein H0T54_03125, partial [Geodermatophilaceae bacterium]|nr:hypothetical protein [Geodermatophilaceae bacterium]
MVAVISGLVFPPNRQPSAESGMRRAMAALRLTDPDALGRAVQRPGDARDTVLAELTVGETYFFREEGQLGVLGTDVLPALIDAKAPGDPLRIWSAGCASGEEPYSLAVILKELGWPHGARILGTDVSRPRLDAARRGRYTRWSLRGVADARVDRWFERRGAQFELDPAIRDTVHFATLNLIADDYPSSSPDTRNQDVVLCRNVLIYFDMTSVAQIATRLLDSLAPNGWLLLGASDPPLSQLVPCETVMTPGGVVYRRADRDPSRAARGVTSTTRTAWEETPSFEWTSRLAPIAVQPDATSAPASTIDSGGDQVEAIRLDSPAAPPAHPPGASTHDDASAYAAADYGRAESLARELLRLDADRLASWVVLVRSIANQGRLREAEAECVQALDRHRQSPELHSLHATLLSAATQHQAAAASARRALYLDPRFVMAHLQLGDALAHLGEQERAERAFENAIAALADVSEDEQVMAADGVPAPRLRHAAEVRLRAMRASRA